MENIKLPLSTSFYIWICSPTLDILITAIAPGRHLLMSAIAVCFTESGPATSLPHYDIRERVAGLQNLSSAKMNQRPKLGSGQGALNVHNWVDVVMSGAGTDRPRQSLFLLVGALR